MRRIIILFLFMGLFAGCNNWLDLQPEDSRVSDQYWTSKEDVQTTMLSCYTRMRECLQQLLIWGELRSENLNVNGIEATEEIGYIHSQDITSDNTFVKWDNMYKVINSANSVITYAPLVLERDPLFSEEEMNAYIAEAKGMRALAYYYLVRAFREVPLLLQPIVSDDYGFVMAKSPEEKIWQQIKEDLQAALKAPNSYSTSNSERWQNYSRLTRWGAATILAEVSLWTGEYEKAKELCALVISSKIYELAEDWFSIFYHGNTYPEETIFSLYFKASNSQTNSLYAWFYNGENNYHYMINADVINTGEGKLYDEDDIRGMGATYYNNFLWKYAGKAVKSGTDKPLRPSDDRSSDWILYRLTDVYLIYAEAAVMSNSPDFRSAVSALNVVKERAQIELLDKDRTDYSQKELLTEILKERQKEFVGEGKRWFDLLRVARIGNFSQYKDLALEIMLQNISLNERPIYQTKLARPGSFYFPIYKDEIDMSGGVLVQNEAYQ